jgi:hypothetical protein
MASSPDKSGGWHSSTGSATFLASSSFDGGGTQYRTCCGG